MHQFHKKDFYGILGVNFEADESQIKSAYRKLARKYHPDVNPDDSLSEKKFKEIGEAYEILSDAKRRKEYDLFKGYLNQKRSHENTSQQAKAQANKAYSEQKQKEQKKEPDKPFNEVFSEFLDGIFQKTPASQTKTQQPPPRAQGPKPEKGDDITVDVSISLGEALNGALRKINVLHTDPCYRCKGRKIINSAPCPACGGKGEFAAEKQLTVKIPSGVKDGSKVRIHAEGNRGLNGGKDGDLFLIIHVVKQDVFTFDKLNVHCEIPITPSEAALGTEIRVPTLDGFVTMKIPPETTSGKKFKLTGQGIIDEKTKQKGDQIITTRIEIPQSLSKEEKELYSKLAELRNFNPREDVLFD